MASLLVWGEMGVRYKDVKLREKFGQCQVNQFF